MIFIWGIIVLLMVFSKDRVFSFFVSLSALLYYMVFPNVADTYHYFQAFNISYYNSESGFIRLQLLIKKFLGNDGLAFSFLKTVPVFLILFFILSAKSAFNSAPIVVSQFMFLGTQNGLRQGLALTSILLLFYLFRGRFSSLLMGSLTFFLHKSGLLFAVLLVGLRSIKNYSMPMLLFIFFTALFLSFLSSQILIFLDLYVNYAGRQTYAESRTNIFIKFGLFSFYLLILEFYLKKLNFKDPFLNDLIWFRRCALVIIWALVFTFNPEIANRFAILFLMIDAAIAGYVVRSNSIYSLHYMLIYGVCTFLSPSILGIFKNYYYGPVF